MTPPGRVSTAARAARLGVKFLSHTEAARRHVSRLAAWAPLFGYRNFKETVYVTLRPHIIVPDGIEDPLDDWRVIRHELVHFERQPEGRFALFRWVLAYGLKQRFRAIEEMHAHLEDIRTGRAPNDIPLVVEKMREWYRLGSIDPAWMVEWMGERL